jgi:hypothetical protein
MLPIGDKYNNHEIDLRIQLSQSKLLKLAEKYPDMAIENFLKFPHTVTEFKELFARVKRIHNTRFGDIVNKFTYQICSNHDYYIVCSGWIADTKAALKGAIDNSNKETVKRILREYPEYASMVINRAYRMLELDIGELACKQDEIFAVGFEIERGICIRIKQLYSHGIEPLWEELSHLHTAPLRAKCLPIRYAAFLNNDRAINTLISHEINTKDSETRNINLDLVNTAIASCALFNSIESLWLMITYYYSHALDGLAAKAIDNKLYRIMNAKHNHSATVRALSSKYAQIGVASLRPREFITKLIIDITSVGNYEAWVVLFYYLIEENETFLELPSIISPIIPMMSQQMLQVFGNLLSVTVIQSFDITIKRILFQQCLKNNLPSMAIKIIEWDNEMLNIAAFHNYNIIHELILLYTNENSLIKSESHVSRGSSGDDSIEYDQKAKLYLSERTFPRQKSKQRLDATLATACYIVKSNYNCAKQLLINNYCFYIDKSDVKLKSAIEEYGDDETKSLFTLLC